MSEKNKPRKKTIIFIVALIAVMAIAAVLGIKAGEFFVTGLF